MKQIALFVLFLSLCPFSLTGQYQADTSQTVKVIGLKLHKGSVLIHSRHLRPIRDSYPTGLEFDLAWHKTSQKAWESCHCYPKMGIAATYWDYDNPEILGQGITALFYIEPVFGARHRVSFSIRAAFGISYQNRPYDAETNPDNLSYSTYIAAPLQLGGNVHVRLKPQWYLDGTIVYNHFSNGGIKQPNKGINWPSVALGVGYYLKEPQFLQRKKVDWRGADGPATRLDLTLFTALNEPKSKTFLLSPGLELKYSRQFARINAYTFGAEWMYDNKARYQMEQVGVDKNPQKGSVAVGHEFLMGKFIFSQQIGVYLYKPYREGDDLYQRYGLVFRASPRISLGANLKAHRHVADFVDFRVGWSW